MSRVVLLDAGPLGLVTNPRRAPQSTACAQWLQSLIGQGGRVIVPEIADYEVRRGVSKTTVSPGTFFSTSRNILSKKVSAVSSYCT